MTTVDIAWFVVICVACWVGAVGQRGLGMGFGVVAMPFLVLGLGPLPAVVAVNALGIAVATMVIGRVWRDIPWRRLTWLGIPALLAVVPGIVLARAADDGVLKVATGGLLIAAIAVTVFVRRRRDEPVLAGHPVAGAVGAATGALMSSVGVGAPLLGIYGALGDLRQRSFAALLQPFFIALSLTTVVMKSVLDPGGAPDWTWWMWAIAVLALAVGVLVGDRIAHRIPERMARRFVLAVSLVGAVSVLVSGVAELTA